ncbi:laccase domain-containing protein [Staphylococcus aureus]
MYTYDSNVLLTMCSADCITYIFIVHHFIALAGWRGTYTEIVKEVLKHVNFDLKDLHVVIGPSTSSSYEINDTKNKLKIPIDSAKHVKLEDEIVMVLILKKANAALLNYYGVPKENIYSHAMLYLNI